MGDRVHVDQMEPSPQQEVPSQGPGFRRQWMTWDSNRLNLVFRKTAHSPLQGWVRSNSLVTSTRAGGLS